MIHPSIPTLLDAIAYQWPALQCTAIGNPDVYNNIISETDVVPSEVEVKKVQLEMYKNTIINCLSEHCENIIKGGFESDALGTVHRYDSDIVDQINLLGAFTMTETTGQSMIYASRDIETGLKEYHEHTPAQLAQVLAAGSVWKLTNLTKFHAKRSYIESIVFSEYALSQVMAVTWDSVEPV